MSSEIIKIPSKLDVLNTLLFIEELKNVPMADEYVFDFRDLFFSEPLGLVAITYGIRKFISERRAKCIDFVNYESRSYEIHMGLFDHFGINPMRPLSYRYKNINYVPISLEFTENIRRESSETGEHVVEVIENYSEEVSGVLIREPIEDLVKTVTYSITEMIRNVLEHSEADQYISCAQYWRQQDIVEFALIDNGIGIRKTLSRNPYIKINSSEDALNLCVLPKISGRAYKRKRSLSKGPYVNRGYGLYMISRICSLGGDFMIISGVCGLYLREQGRNHFYIESPGTAIRLRMRGSAVTLLSKMLSSFEKEGTNIAKEMGIGKKVVTAPQSDLINEHSDFNQLILR